MNIIYHHRTRGLGVEGVHIDGIINALKGLGHDVIICSMAEVKLENEKPHGKQVLFNFISRIAPQVIFEVFELLYNFISFYRLYKVIKSNRIDFIYERYARYSISSAIIKRIFKIPVILEVNILSTMQDVRGMSFKYFSIQFEKFILNNASLIVVVSGYLAAETKKIIKNDIPIVVTSNAVSTAFLQKNRFIKKAKKGINNVLIIGFVGRLVPWYKLEEFLNIIPDVMKKTEKEIQIQIVGDGVLRKKLESLVKELKISDKVTFWGEVAHSNISEFISQLDIAVLPNSNDWGSPMKLFEYMAMGRAVIAVGVGPVKEVISHFSDGILFDKNNFSQLKYHLVELTNNHKLRERLGRNAREKVEKKHTWEINAKKIIDVYMARR